MGITFSSECEEVEGTVAKGFEEVRQLFSREECAQLCVYVGGELVVDLWKGHPSCPDYSNNTLTNIFSSGKSLTSLAFAMMEDRGHIKYTAKLVEYWPEFCGLGREGISVADLLRHEAGYANQPQGLDSLEDLLPENIQANSVGKLYTSSEAPGPQWPAKGKREYHPISRGLIANEVFRRVHPQGLTMGQFLREELVDKLDLRVFVGCREEEMDDFQPVRMASGVLAPLRGARGLSYRDFPSFFYECYWTRMEFLVAGNPVDYMAVNSDGFRKGELVSGCGNANAASLAILASHLACGGGPLLSKRACQEMHSCVTSAGLLGERAYTHFSQCGVNLYRSSDFFCHGREGFWGWQGFGGSVFQWHPELQIGFAFVPSVLELDLTNQRAGLLQETVVRCVRERARKMAEAEEGLAWEEEEEEARRREAREEARGWFPWFA